MLLAVRRIRRIDDRPFKEGGVGKKPAPSKEVNETIESRGSVKHQGLARS